MKRNRCIGVLKIQGDFYKKLSCPTLDQMLKVFHFPDLALQMATQNGSGSVSILLEWIMRGPGMIQWLGAAALSSENGKCSQETSEIITKNDPINLKHFTENNMSRK